MNVLVIEDDPILNKNICSALEAENIHATSVFDGGLASRILKSQDFDCVIMDINLPGKTGFDLCREFRSYNRQTPVLMLTAFGELEDKVKGFDLGADDYLTKPFYIRELLLRVRSLINRTRNSTSSRETNDVIVAGDIRIHPAQKKVYKKDKEIALTPREYQILKKLCLQKGEVISKNELIEEIWGTAFDANTNTVEVYINFLRNKIDRPFNTATIKTKVGYGYYFEPS